MEWNCHDRQRLSCLIVLLTHTLNRSSIIEMHMLEIAEGVKFL